MVMNSQNNLNKNHYINNETMAAQASLVQEHLLLRVLRSLDKKSSHPGKTFQASWQDMPSPQCTCNCGCPSKPQVGLQLQMFKQATGRATPG